ncbi:hypothetical protein K435DRAFT_808375 [Dendrothele bispora CBS 962.96]|uniref:Uncharacterized protein n=1 Tax=Dendrothele bispora (strain CBS 962.96) TaxID=1314807 RepID=A0A4S8L216_DENBC|nr:hypothetical protein K435DRAFT_808375 [Dendrothele bispora CBS 962.96]
MAEYYTLLTCLQEHVFFADFALEVCSQLVAKPKQRISQSRPPTSQLRGPSESSEERLLALMGYDESKEALNIGLGEVSSRHDASPKRKREVLLEFKSANAQLDILKMPQSPLAAPQG